MRCVLRSECCTEFSRLHSATTISIAKNYYPPSKRKGRDVWMPNAQLFMKKFGNSPEHLRNRPFSYVVVLRALKKAAPFLQNTKSSKPQRRRSCSDD
eukprot:Selendium_serpulae@DN6210_c1_g1_i7.p3